MTAKTADRRDSLAIVVDQQYGNRLASLYERHKLWVTYSEANQAAIEQLWKTDPHLPSEMGLTIGTAKYQSADVRENFEQMLGSVLEHFALERIVVVGFDKVDESFVDAVMAEEGFVRDRATTGLEYLRTP